MTGKAVFGVFLFSLFLFGSIRKYVYLCKQNLKHLFFHNFITNYGIN